jgi:hypothetical protein
LQYNIIKYLLWNFEFSVVGFTPSKSIVALYFTISYYIGRSAFEAPSSETAQIFKINDSEKSKR